MYPLITSLFLVPVIVSGLLLILPKSVARILVITSSLVLAALSLYVFINLDGVLYFGVPHYVNDLVAVADTGLFWLDSPSPEKLAGGFDDCIAIRRIIVCAENITC